MFKYFAIGIPISVTIFDCLGYAAKVEGISMQPTLNPDANSPCDIVFLNRWYSRSFCYKRGEVVSVISPKDPSQKFIKRVIALEGDLVRTTDYKQKYIRVPPGHCWVEGDNSGHSLDSNLLGPIAVGLITAKASHIVWPPSRWSKIESEIPSTRLPARSTKGSDHFLTLKEFEQLLEED